MICPDCGGRVIFSPRCDVIRCHDCREKRARQKNDESRVRTILREFYASRFPTDTSMTTKPTSAP